MIVLEGETDIHFDSFIACHSTKKVVRKVDRKLFRLIQWVFGDTDKTVGICI